MRRASFGGQVNTFGAFVGLTSGGSAIAQSGLIRLPGGAQTDIVARDSTNAFDILFLRTGVVATNDFTIGEVTNLAQLNLMAAIAMQFRTTTYSFRDSTGATDFLIVDSTGVHGVTPFGGSSADNKTFQLAEATQAMADANQTPTSAIYQAPHLITTGAITANRDLVLPAIIGSTFLIDNQCTNAFSVVVKVSGQAGVAIANGKKAIVKLNSAHTDYVRVTPDT